MFSQLFNNVKSRVGEVVANDAALKLRKDAEFAPKEYQAPQSYEPFSQSFQPSFDQSQVTDIYQRGAMPNDLLARYNAMAKMLQQQQAAMVPRTQPQGMAPFVSKPNPYTNFAQLFGGRNG